MLPACGDDLCHDTGGIQWLVVTVEHAEQPGTYAYTVDADGVAGTCTWQAGAAGARPDCAEMPGSIELDVDETGVDRITVDDTPDHVSLIVSRDGEVLFEQAWTREYRVTTDKKPGCGRDGLRGDLTASFRWQMAGPRVAMGPPGVPMTRAALLTLALLLPACAADDPSPDKADDADESGDTDGDTPPEPWSEFYSVESHIEAGGFAFDETYWARRDLDPGAGTITELFVATADGTETWTVLQIDADAGTFTLDINEGEYTGEGTLDGEPWAWTAWSSRSEMSDGSYVESEDAVTATGIHADKQGFAADGTPEWTLTEDLTTVDEDAYEAGLAAIGGR
jgi:hypothetical protein